MAKNRPEEFEEYPSLSKTLKESRMNSPWLISDKMLSGLQIPLFIRKSTNQHLISFEIISHLLRIFQKDGFGAWDQREVEELLPPRWKKHAGDLEKSSSFFSTRFVKAAHFSPTLIDRQVGKQLNDFLQKRRKNVFGIEDESKETQEQVVNEENSEENEQISKENKPLYPGDLLIEGFNCPDEGYLADQALLEAVLKGTPGFISIKNHPLVIDENGKPISRTHSKGSSSILNNTKMHGKEESQV